MLYLVEEGWIGLFILVEEEVFVVSPVKVVNEVKEIWQYLAMADSEFANVLF